MIKASEFKLILLLRVLAVVLMNGPNNKTGVGVGGFQCELIDKSFPHH